MAFFSPGMQQQSDQLQQWQALFGPGTMPPPGVLGSAWSPTNPGGANPGGFSPIVPGSTTVSPGYQGGAVPAAGGANAGGAPPYVNMSDPVQAFVWQGFQQKGVSPRDQGDFQYWVDNVNRTGGLTDTNKGYWSSRFAQGNGGIGDYGQGSGGTMGGMYGGNGQYQGGPFSMPSLDEARNSPGYQFAQQQGMDAIQRSAAAKGTLLTGGTLKALQGYGTGLADQTYGNVFNRALQTNQQNYNQLYGFGKLGVDASTSAAS